MGMVIDFEDAKKHKPAAAPVDEKPVQQSELDYLADLGALVAVAKQLSETYKLAPKDILTDSLCLLIEDAILEECSKAD